MKYLVFIVIIANIYWIDASEESNARILRSYNKNDNLNEFDLNLNKANLNDNSINGFNSLINDDYLDNLTCNRLCKITDNLKPNIRCLRECFKKEGSMSTSIVLNKCEKSCDVNSRRPLCFLRCLKRRNEYPD